MVEIIEYALAFAVSSGLAASGFVLLQGYYPLVNQMVLRSEFSQIANAAEAALVSNTSKTLTVDLNSVSISCQGNLLALASGATTYSSALNGSCQTFNERLAGKHTLAFVPDNGILTIRIDS